MGSSKQTVNDLIPELPPVECRVKNANSSRKDILLPFLSYFKLKNDEAAHKQEQGVWTGWAGGLLDLRRKPGTRPQPSLTSASGPDASSPNDLSACHVPLTHGGAGECPRTRPAGPACHRARRRHAPAIGSRRESPCMF